MAEYLLNSAEDTRRFGVRMAAALESGDTVCLRGELGSGKSVLARGMAEGLGVKGHMPSPTFTLMQPYEGRVPVYHFDLYRLEDADEFYAAGLSDYIGGDGVALIEWPMDEVLGDRRIEIQFERGASEDERRVFLSFFGLGERAKRIEEATREWEIRA